MPVCDSLFVCKVRSLKKSKSMILVPKHLRGNLVIVLNFSVLELLQERTDIVFDDITFLIDVQKIVN